LSEFRTCPFSDGVIESSGIGRKSGVFLAEGIGLASERCGVERFVLL
jgi:hypothetical protein